MQPWLSGNQHSRQRNKATEPGHLPLTSQSLPLLTLCVQLQCTLSAKPRTGTTATLLSPSEGRTLQLIPGSGGGIGGNTTEVFWSLLLGGQNNKGDDQVLPAHPPLHSKATLLLASGCGDSTGISWTWSPIAHCVPLWVSPLGLEQSDHGGGAHLPREHRPFSTT